MENRVKYVNLGEFPCSGNGKKAGGEKGEPGQAAVHGSATMCFVCNRIHPKTIQSAAASGAFIRCSAALLLLLPSATK
jgi:hypothetical protein